MDYRFPVLGLGTANEGPERDYEAHQREDLQ
jgi:hypothetical protein